MLVDELATLKLLETRENWERYGRRVPVRALSDTCARVVQGLGHYYATKREVLEINWDGFAAWWRQDYKSEEAPNERALIDAVIARVKGYAPDAQITSALTSAWSKAGLIQDAAECLLKLRTGQLDEAPDIALLRLVGDYRQGAGAHVDAAGGPSIRLSEHGLEGNVAAKPGEGYEWGLEDMNVALGPMRPGDFVLVGGRPEIGKTSFVVSETAAMVQGTDATILVVNNEEGSHRILRRYLSCVLGRSIKDLSARMPEALAEMYKRGWREDQLQVYDAHGAALGAIEDEIERVNPTFLVLHRIDKMPQVKVAKNANEVQRIADLAFWARRQAAAGRIVIGVCQADTSAVNQKFVYDHQLYGSKTALQAETDAIITIGAESVFDDVRGVHVPRNKLEGGPRSSEHKRHGFFETKFDHVTGRYETIIYRESAR